MKFVKGHGTGNDFILLPDPDGELILTPNLVRALCDRHSGLGADGVLRVVRTASVTGEVTAVVGDHAATATGPAAIPAAPEWFMDYHNADGTIAEMCGNGVRVYARYLVDSGLLPPGQHSLATRGGIKQVSVPERGDITVDMGAPVVIEWPPVTVKAGPRSWAGLQVDMGNPHVAVAVRSLADAGPLSEAPTVTPAGAFPSGVNVEFVHIRGPGRVSMRVHERGVGETLSCGTGACAAAVAAAQWAGDTRPTTYEVTVPGGSLVVRWTDETITLTGAAVLVAEGELRPGWPDTVGR